jgi:hypothetical protein
MILYPEYKETDRYYEVKFYDADGNIVPQLDKNTGVQKDSWLVKYGTVYDGPVGNFLYRDDSQLGDELRYAF